VLITLIATGLTGHARVRPAPAAPVRVGQGRPSGVEAARPPRRPVRSVRPTSGVDAIDVVGPVRSIGPSGGIDAVDAAAEAAEASQPDRPAEPATPPARVADEGPHRSSTLNGDDLEVPSFLRRER
jgi:hypothetical protein